MHTKMHTKTQIKGRRDRSQLGMLLAVIGSGVNGLTHATVCRRASNFDISTVIGDQPVVWLTTLAPLPIFQVMALL